MEQNSGCGGLFAAESLSSANLSGFVSGDAAAGAVSGAVVATAGGDVEVSGVRADLAVAWVVTGVSWTPLPLEPLDLLGVALPEVAVWLRDCLVVLAMM